MNSSSFSKDIVLESSISTIKMFPEKPKVYLMYFFVKPMFPTNFTPIIITSLIKRGFKKLPKCQNFTLEQKHKVCIKIL